MRRCASFSETTQLWEYISPQLNGLCLVPAGDMLPWTPGYHFTTLFFGQLLSSAIFFAEIMVEISQNKQLHIRLVKLEREVMKAQMWEGVMYPCVLPTGDMPITGSPSCPRCCAGIQRCLLVGFPLHWGLGYLLRDLEGQNPLLDTALSHSVLHGSHYCSKDEKLTL